MHGCLLQDWVTIRGAIGISSIAQGADSWLDIGDCEDLAFFLDVRDVSNAQIVYETSPSKQEQSFVAMVGLITPTIGQRVDRVFSSLAAIPPARLIRWRISNTSISPCEITFRVWVATYAWVKG